MRTLLISAALLGSVASGATLEEVFHNPPPSARPHTWWHWMNGNVTKEGITLDLEAMARVGIGGAQIFNVADKGSCDIPKGPADYLSPLFLEMVKHAATEAKRLGIEICLHNGPGWSSSGGPWIDPAHSMQLLVAAEVQATAAGRIRLPQPETRKGYYRDIAVLAFPTPANAAFRIPQLPALTSAALQYHPPTAAINAPADAATAHAKVVDISNKLAADGTLDWSPPAPGAWTIVRFGHTTSGKTNHPASESGIGLECDKMSREALDLHWQKGIQPILDYLGPVGTHGLNNLLIDSYEVGPNTWTPEFREEFTKRRGYDLLPYLPALAGHVIDDGTVSSRVLWDFRRTVADLFADNYYAYFAELCHKAGLLASVEPYDGPFECLASGRGYDIIMGEFWTAHGKPDPDFNWEGTINHSVKIASSVAHVNGKTFIGAESFTAGPPNGRWQNYPGLLKQLGECVWCLGINRYIFHRNVQQPWGPDVVPGMTMGQWGTHFDRGNTWWEPSRAWMAYIARSQALLQQGRFAADVLYFGGENAPAAGVNSTALKRAGHDSDALGTDLFYQLRVDHGELVLPGGMRYRLLVMPNETTMTVALAAKLHELIDAGANVLLGPKPTRTPNLASNTTAADAELAQHADASWSAPPPAAGKLETGRVLSGMTPEAAMEKLGIAPQVDCPPQIRWIERLTADHAIYFISNQSGQPFEGPIEFRTVGMVPSLFDPVTGNTAPAQVWKSNKNTSSVTLSLPSAGSVFVVFGAGNPTRSAFVAHSFETLSPAPEPAAKPAGHSVPPLPAVIPGPTLVSFAKERHSFTHPDGSETTVETTAPPPAVALTGPWQVAFQARRGAPPAATFETLASLHESPDPGIRYFSGTAVWKTTFQVPASPGTLAAAPILLDLGRVCVIAELRLNGHDLGILWHDPFRIDVASHLQPGTNTLEVAVTNLWVNRLIGDEQLPADVDWRGHALAKWPDWFVNHQARPSKDRVTFTTWHHWNKDDPLQPSGLIGPVILRYGTLTPLR